ncbi:MAG: hypothetical protein FWF78_10165, partial [Defluviitaleaceae bacterium]|nr:hypothetical protein [Defluviitaleaceae bacterium]
MNSFTKKLVLNCTGVIFTSFLVVYFLFNVMVSSYIRSEAERELMGNISGAAGLTDVFHMRYTESFGEMFGEMRIVGAGGIRLMPSPMAEPFEIVQRIEGDDRFVI